MTLTTDGATWLGARLQEAAGRSVTYRRGTDEITVTGAATMHTYLLPNSDGVATEVTSYDWMIPSADLEINSTPIVPRPGDQIRETLDGQEVWWEVLELSESRPCVEWADTSGILFFIHTRRVK